MITITLLDVYGKPVESLSNWYIKYALTSTGAQLQTEYNHATGSCYWLGETPPGSLQDFFRLMKPATSVFVNKRQLGAITNAHDHENNVLRKAYHRQEYYTHQAAMDIDSNFALAVQTQWTMDARHNDFEFHEQHSVPKHQAGITAANQYINEVAVSLERRIPPRKYTAEQDLLSYIPANCGWESYIVGANAPDPAPRQAVTLAQLSSLSVVSEVARLVSRDAFHGGQLRGAFTELAECILAHFHEMNLDPMILRADQHDLKPPTFNEQINLAAHYQQLPNHESATFDKLLNHSKKWLFRCVKFMMQQKVL